VRSLAQRSAEAAREIRTLIMASVERVEHGSALVDRAGHTMNEVVASIRRVSNIVNEISAAAASRAMASRKSAKPSRAWTAPLRECGLGRTERRSGRQLKQQAQQLVKTVAVFKLETNQPSEHPRI
jgi:methyl-accepting chemotaxis protein